MSGETVDRTPQAAAPAEKVKIFGERNTGTHALADLIESNSASRCLPSVAKDVEPDSARSIASRFIGSHRREARIDAIFARHGPLMSWKHRATNFTDASAFAGVLVLFTVRHPASWLLSLWKHPYHALDRLPRDIGAFIDFQWRTVERDALERATFNPLELYKAKMNAAQAFADRLEAADIGHRFVRFEDLVLRQEAVFRDIAPGLVDPSPRFSAVRKSTKDPRKDLDYYARYYGEEQWRAELAGLENHINEQVDWSALKPFGYSPL